MEGTTPTGGGTASSGTSVAESTGLVPTQLAVLVPTFDPSRDDLTAYTKKVQLLTGMWPDGKWTELATRLILGCQGSAFLKLQIHQQEVTKNERKSVQRIIEILGGHWGQINLEKQYEHVERALFRCQQKGDESADSFLARADIMWSELLARDIKLEDIQPYITLRGSLLSGDDKKRVLLDVDAAGSGKLSMDRVASAIRMLGAGFFQDVTGQKRNKGKTYDQTTLIAESQDLDDEPSSALHTEGQDDLGDEEIFEALVQEGDEDASLVADFESAAADILQGDEELASAYTAYVEARRRLNEKTRFRGFWPVSQSKGKFKGGFKGRGRSFKGASNRKTLQQRILESRCRICNKMGHWKAECPQRGNQSEGTGSSRGSSSQVPTSFVSAQSQSFTAEGGLPLEFLELPTVQSTIMEDAKHEFSLVSFGGEDFGPGDSKTQLRHSLDNWEHSNQCRPSHRRIRSEACNVRLSSDSRSVEPTGILPKSIKRVEKESVVRPDSTHVGVDVACFASHGSYGVVDLGATKTVIGSELLQDLIGSLQPEIRSQLSRCPCAVTFRFGNHGLLQSTQALVVPIQGFLLKIAIVPGSTPFLISNTLLRAMGAIINTNTQSLFASRINREIPLHLTEKGLFLLDLNDLANSKADSKAKEADTLTIEESKAAEYSSPSSPLRESQNAACHKTKNNNRNPYEIGDKIKSEDHTMIHNQEPSEQPETGSSDFARSFVVPDRSFSKHVQACPEIAESAESSRSDCPRPFAVQPGGPRELHHLIRQSPSGRDLQTCVGDRSGMGSLVRESLPKFEEDGSQVLSPLRGNESGTCGTDRRTCSTHDTHRDPRAYPIGQWEPIPEGKGKGQVQWQGHQQQSNGSRFTRSSGSGGRRLPVGDGRGGRDQRSNSISRCEPSRDQDATHGKCVESSDCTFGTSHALESAIDPQRSSGLEIHSQELHALIDAGDLSSEWYDVAMFSEQTSERNQERKVFEKLVQQYQQEYLEVSKQINTTNSRTDILEVFCGAHSQLTHQCRQLGFKAERFGREQCDLQTRQGREQVFRYQISHRPKHVWFSPSCGPWSGWSHLNGSKSIQAWDELQRTRMHHLEQIALGIVMFRHQRISGDHFHWEQPRSSLMFRLPYLAEAFHYLLSVDFEMCVAGKLVDPQNGKPIRKGMTIMSTSQRLVDMLSRCRCSNHHDHQTIEGRTTYQGQNLNRSEYTERYPRKFARRVVLVLCKIMHPSEKPYMPEKSFPVLVNHDEEQPAKRRKTAIARPKMSRVLDVEALPWGKRQRCLGKTTPVQSHQEWKNVFEELHQSLPRVGKVVLPEDGEVLTQLKGLIADKEVRCAIACRGSSRTMAPPSFVAKGEAPFRRCVFTDRETGTIKVEEDWESWEELSQRQLVRPSHCSRITITVFASNPSKITEAVTSHRDPIRDPSAVEPIPPSMSNPDEVPELTQSQNCDFHSPQQDEAFRRLPRDEQIALMRAHRNLGHPSPERLSTILRQQGFRAEVAKAALQLRCSVCQESSQPKGSRPSTLRDDMDFNDRVSIDGFKWTNGKGKNFHVYHIVDWATSFHAASIAPSRSSEEAINTVITLWLSWAGAPSEMIVDAGTEFNSEEFSAFVQKHNIKLTTISSEAHFQNGRSERHGAVLQNMLSRFDKEHPIDTYQDLHRSLWWCTQAKNSSSLRKGYAPEVLVLGKHTRLPGAVSSDDLLPAHMLAESETAHGIQFRKQLEYRECARRAFHYADNDAALRKAVLRRSHPLRQDYQPGEWVMIWREGKEALPGSWIGPMKVVVHENAQTVWTTMSSKLYRVAPEHIRPVSASEAQKIRIYPNDPSVSKIAQQIQGVQGQGVTQTIGNGNPNGDITYIPEPQVSPEAESHDSPPHGNLTSPHQSEGQPDDEPEVPSQAPSTNPEVNSEPNSFENPMIEATGIPIPEDSDDELVCEGLYCQDVEADIFQADTIPQAWRCEIVIEDNHIQEWKREDNPEEMIFLVSAAKKQRAEVKLATLSSKEKAEFETAKDSEVQNWIKTGTIAKIMRDKIPADQILKCRWIFTWKPLDEEDQKKHQKTKKAKARLVILGYLDPQIEQLPRDSPTLGRHSNMVFALVDL